MPPVQYRLAAPSDAPILAPLPAENEAGGASEDRMRRYLAGEHHPQQALPPRVMWAAYDEEAVIGYIAGHLTRRYGCDGELQWIYVVPSHRGTGVASHLVGLLADWFRKQGAARVCVDVGDDRARKFYRRHGATDLNAHWMVWEDIGKAIDPGR